MQGPPISARCPVLSPAEQFRRPRANCCGPGVPTVPAVVSRNPPHLERLCKACPDATLVGHSCRRLLLLFPLGVELNLLPTIPEVLHQALWQTGLKSKPQVRPAALSNLE